MNNCFLNEKRIINSTWQSFERDVARLMMLNGFDDVRIVGGTGDNGADILAVNSSGLWVIQCKYTTASVANKSALDEILNAGEKYSADRLCVALSRPPSDNFIRYRNNIRLGGPNIQIWQPKELIQLANNALDFSSYSKKLRDYQINAMSVFRDCLVDTGKAQMVLATGLGKTTIMASVVQDLFLTGALRNNRVLVLAHMRDLVSQLHLNFWSQLSSKIPTQQMSEGELPVTWEGVTFATFQSARQKLDHLPEFDLILVDEAHHVGAESFMWVLDELKPKMLGGATATPWRSDGFNIDELLGKPVVKVGIAEGLAKGFLAEVDYRILADNIDWGYVQRMSLNNYSIKELNKKLLIPTRDEEAANVISQTFKDENRTQGIIFSPSIEHARHFSSILRMFGLSCELITSDMNKQERSLVLARFRKGEFQLALTIDIFNEGVDVPDVDVIIFMRATHSRRIFIQQLGRGLRITPNKKSVIVLDFVSDLRRMLEVVELDSEVKGIEVEKVGLGKRLIEFSDKASGSFLQEWLLDQADLLNNDSATLTLPKFDFPGNIGVQ
jgi:superfamily II DNA or RNA helicase